MQARLGIKLDTNPYEDVSCCLSSFPSFSLLRIYYRVHGRQAAIMQSAQ